MKIRSKAFAIVCFLAVILSAVIVYSGCSKKVTLDAPSDLQINEKFLTWSKVENVDDREYLKSLVSDTVKGL